MRKIERCIERPKKRSVIRRRMGMLYYGLLRRYLWIRMKKKFASQKSTKKLHYSCFSHKTLLLRKLKDVDMWLQHNKIINLKIAANQLNGIIIRPGEVFSYWKLIGKPTKKKGYVDGMVLQDGTFTVGTGGGLCQMSNLIFWMALHTPLTVIERHRHGYDVFPDSNRTQPFGSGATCFYLHGDLMLRNDTENEYQLNIWFGENYLEGEWSSSCEPECTYQIVEKSHQIKGEFWGGYSRHNELYKQEYDHNGNFVNEELVVKNSAIMMYSPILADKSSTM